MGLLTAIAAVATIGGLYYGNRATNQQARANEFQRKQASLSAARSRRDQVRQNRLALADAQVKAGGAGVDRSSGAYGGQGSIQSQGLSNLTYIDQMNKLSDQASSALGKAITLGGYAQMFQGVSSLAMSFSQMDTTKPGEAEKLGKTPAPIEYRGTHPTQTNSVAKGMIY